jgi:hypothetical protein
MINPPFFLSSKSILGDRGRGHVGFERGCFFLNSWFISLVPAVYGNDLENREI